MPFSRTPCCVFERPFLKRSHDKGNVQFDAYQEGVIQFIDGWVTEPERILATCTYTLQFQVCLCMATAMNEVLEHMSKQWTVLALISITNRWGETAGKLHHTRT